MYYDLAVETQIYRLDFPVLLTPALQMRDVNFVALQEIRLAQMDQDWAVVVGHGDFYIFGIALLYRDSNLIRQQPHHSSRMHPGHAFELAFAIVNGNEEDVPADIAAENIEHLRTGDVLRSLNCDLLTRFHAKSRRDFSIVIEPGCGEGHREH